MKTNIFRPKNLFMIFLGNTTMALGIVMFVLPNELMTGGTTGLSLIINHYLHLPISVFVFIFNCIMFLLGALILGFDFALTTLISTFYYPFIRTGRSWHRFLLSDCTWIFPKYPFAFHNHG